MGLARVASDPASRWIPMPHATVRCAFGRYGTRPLANNEVFTLSRWV
jgi:hypothetical protein